MNKCVLLLLATDAFHAPAQPHPIVLHAARMLDIEAGTVVSPGWGL